MIISRSTPPSVRTTSLALAGLSLFVCGSVAHASGSLIQYGCILSAMQETPPVASSALGAGTFIIDTDANTVTYRIAFTGLVAAETAAHIHGFAGPGTPAGVLVALPAGNPKVGVWNYAEAQEADILAGRTYANIHSATFGGGEIRGQIGPLNCTIDGAQETPPVATTATGWGVFTIDTVANMLNYYVAFTGLSSAESAAHIHGNATSLHGTPAGVLVGLPAGSPKVGSWNYPEVNEELILSGRTYVNIHSTSFGGGEIRGQIVPIVVPMDGQQETPPIATTAAGFGLVAFRTETNELSFDVRFGGLSGAETAAHIHGFAPPGTPAGVLMPLPAGSPKLGVWNFGPINEPLVLDGQTYFNIHSTSFGGGEIRGQIADFRCRPVVGVPDHGVPVLPLVQNYPNPLRSGTTIRFTLEREANVAVTIYDAQGRLVRSLFDGSLGAGLHPITWDGQDDAGRLVPAGVYHYVLSTPEGTRSEQLTVLR